MMTEAQYVKAVPADGVQDPGPRRPRRVSGAKLKADDIVRHVIFTTAHAYLLFFSNRGKVYRLRALDIPERERTAKGMPIVNLLPLQAGRDDPGDHRHPRLRRRALPVLRHPQGHGQEDVVRRVRLEPSRRAHRHQPARRRRAGAGHRDQRQRRHLHGQPQGHDDPLQRGRRAPDGPHRGRRARHEAASRTTRSCRSTSPATTRRS